MMDGRDLNVICVTETKGKNNNTIDQPGSWVVSEADILESERECQGVDVL